MAFLVPIITTFILSLVITPLIKKLAIKIGALDKPDERKVHKKLMPRLGGLAIYFSFLAGVALFPPDMIDVWPIVTGATVIIMLGILDDIFTLSAKVKFLGQIVAALIPVLAGIQINYITIPDGNVIEFGYLAIPISVFWIVSITNAINLIDGLDGLAAGVSSIALISISTLAFSLGNSVATFISILLLGSTLGFLVYNFYPAKIFMGDTGSLFLGYMISVVAILGFTKSATILSLIIPIIILGVPIIDTTFAIIRRIVNGKPLTAPDKYHLHHCLIRLGFSHRQSVVLIYLLSALFSLAAIIFSRSTVWGSSILIVALIVLVELIVEVTGLISENYRPILNLIDGKRQKNDSLKGK